MPRSPTQSLAPRRGGCKGSRCAATVHPWMQLSFLPATTVQTVPARHFRGTSTDGPWSLRGRMRSLHGRMTVLALRIGTDRRQFANPRVAAQPPALPSVAPRLCELATWRRIAPG